jgi:dipeptidyl aminopeptidase/acylaminoacyl peptidase
MKARNILSLLAMGVAALVNCTDHLPLEPGGPTLPDEARRDIALDTQLAADGRIVFSTGLGISIMNADGTNAVQVLARTSVRDPSWSPDGQKIAFSGASGIYVVNSDGTGLDQMTSTDTTAVNCHRRPRWSPDGTRIVFYRHTACTSRPRSIMIVDVATKQVTTVINPGGASHAFPDWSHDGTRIVFSMPNPTGIYVVNVDGSNLTEISSVSGNARPSWSPDDSLIAYNAVDGGQLKLWLMNPDGSDVTLLPTVPTSGPFASWSPDGTRILYQAQTSFDTGPLRIIHADGSGDVAITGSVGVTGYDWGAASPPPPPPNSAPTAPTVDCTPTSTPTGQAITCIASGSTDVDGDAITYVWSATDRSGAAQGTSTTYSRALPGTTDVIAYATDGTDNSNNSNEVTLTFTNRSPTAPTVACEFLTATTGETISCSASGSTDPDGGTITYNWSATDRTGSATGSSTTYSRSTAGGTSVTAYASDNQGGQSDNSATVTLTFNNPPPPPPIATTTVVSADPASPSSAVASVTFTAHVTRTSNGADVTTGNVEFRNGGTDCSSGTVLQSAAAVDGTGRKTFTTRVLQSRYAIRACYLGASPYVASNGAIVWPPDTDGDGIVDAIDEQPLVPSTRFNRNNVTVGRIVSVPSYISYYAYPGGWTNGVSWEFTIAPGATGIYADVIVIQLDGKATRYELHPFVNNFGNVNSCFAGKPCAIQISDPPASVALEVLAGEGTMVVVVNGETVVITVANGATATVTEYKNSSGAVTEIAVEATGPAGGVTVNGYPIAAGTTTAFGRLQATTKISSGKAPSLNLSGSFTPGSSSDGMNPLTEQAVVRAGPYTWTIPAGAFRLNSDGAYVYSGILNGVTVSAQIKKPAAKKGGAWTFQVTASPITTFAMPAPIFLRIGNDAGSTSG